MGEQPDPVVDIVDTHEITPQVKGEDSRTVPFSELVGERRRAAEAKRTAAAAEARAKAAEEARAKLEADAAEWRKSHDAWTAHQTAESERSTKALAERLAALPDDVRADIEADIESGTPAAQVLRWIERAEKMAGTKPAAQAEAVKPAGYPAGGRGPSGVPAQDELSPEIKKWVETRRPDLAGVNPATVRKMYDKFSGAK